MQRTALSLTLLFLICAALVVRLSLIFAVSVLAADTGTMTFRVRDSLTHFPIQAVIKGDGPTSFSLVTDAKGEGKVTLPEGEYRLEISARDHDLLRTHYVIRAGKITTAGGFLDSQVTPEEERPEAIEPLLRSGYTLLHEYVVDADTGDPIPGVKVRFVQAGVETQTDGRGHFFLSVLTPRPKYPGGLGTDTLIYERAGYKTLVLRNFGIGLDDMGPTAIEMSKGKGIIDKDATHKLLREGELQEEAPQTATPSAILSTRLYSWLANEQYGCSLRWMQQRS